MLWLWQSTGQELGKELVYPIQVFVCLLNLLLWGKKGNTKEKKREKEEKNIGLLTWPAFNVILCPIAFASMLAQTNKPTAASIVMAMRGSIQTRLLPRHTSAPLFMHAVCTPLITPPAPRVSHIPFKTQRSIQPRPANLLRPTDSGTEGWATARGSRGWSVERKRRAPTSMPRRAAGHGGSARLANACGKSGRSGGRPSCIT